MEKDKDLDPDKMNNTFFQASLKNYQNNVRTGKLSKTLDPLRNYLGHYNITFLAIIPRASGA